MARKKRSDSAAAKIAAFAGAVNDIEPPKPLAQNEIIYWHDIVRARAREDWTAIDLMHAWNLAKLMAYIEVTHKEIAEQGMTLVNAKGTPGNNPAFVRLENLSRLKKKNSTKMNVKAGGTVGKREDSAKRATKQRKAAQIVDGAPDLIARPTLQ